MSKQVSRKRAASDEYEADGGFVEDAPKSKKNKASESKGKASDPQYWELSRTRRVQINEFKGKQLIDFREYYEKDDELLPGKKGISLSMEQFQAFLESLPEIEKALQAKGISIPRPKYDGASSGAADNNEEDETEDKAEAASEEEGKPIKAGRLDRFKHRANHEATSDEDN
ncbi:hypothetical protein Q7P37_006221 [Cladosporium fusiforme]